MSQNSAFRIPQSAIRKLLDRRVESHKGDYGRALLVGGSRGMAGAISLAGMTALRGGAGLVKLAVPRACQDVVAGFEPSYMTVGLPSDEDGKISVQALGEVLELVTEATALALGPGLGQSDAIDELTATLYRDAKKPIVVDADALNALSRQREVLAEHAGPRILTPHPGEFSRLVGEKHDDPQRRNQAAAELAARCDVIVVLKGHQTLVTDGRASTTNQTGNPGMATGGTGDVLTGLITALLCQGLTPWEAARLGAYLHGLAGDLAVEQRTQPGLIASDLIEFLPAAWKQAGTGSS